VRRSFIQLVLGLIFLGLSGSLLLWPILPTTWRDAVERLA
jgi:hypothetical protein